MPVVEVPSLRALSLKASCRLVISGCKQIVDLFSSPHGRSLAYDAPGCRDAVKEVQDHLRDNIIPALWEPLVDAVVTRGCEEEVHDERVLYSILLFPDVPLRKFMFPKLPEAKPVLYLHQFLNNMPLMGAGDEVADNYENIVYESRVKFWCETAAMLEHLVEVDLTDVYCEGIVVAVLLACKKLQVVKVPDVSAATLMFVVKSNKSLKKLHCWNTNDSDVPENIVRFALRECPQLEIINTYISDTILASMDGVLRLRSLYLEMTTSDCIDVVSHCCPDLKNLYVSDECVATKTSCEDVLLKIVTCQLKNIEKLILDTPVMKSTVVGQILSQNNFNVTELTLLKIEISGSISDCLAALSNCHHLIKLFFYDVGFTQEHVATGYDRRQILFPKLQHLIVYKCRDAVEGFDLASMCLNAVDRLTTFSFVLPNEDGDCEELVIELFGLEQMVTLQEVYLHCGRMMVTVPLLRHVVDSCPEMTSLKIGELNVLAEIDMNRQRRRMKSERRDIVICELEYPNIGWDIFD